MEFNKEDQKVVAKFKQEVKSFFFEGVRGNLWPYLYGAPQSEDDPVRGGILYNQMLEAEEDYYLYRYEANLFQTKGEIFENLIGPGATFIELGPGSEQSLRLKTLPLLKSLPKLHGYVGIDISQSFLDKSLAVVRDAFPHIVVQGSQQDFTQLQELPQYEKTVVFFKGSTIANLRRSEVPHFIAQIKALLDNDHFLLLVHDANQDAVSLLKAYGTARIAAVFENMMYRIKRDLALVDLQPEAFRYTPVWKPEIHDLQHVLVATQPQSFEIDGQTVAIKAGQEFHILSSFKYPVAVFQEMIASVGYQPIDLVHDSSGRMAAHLFQS